MSKRAVLVCCIVVALATSVGTAAQYEFFRTAWSVALFSSAGPDTYVGLRVKFSAPVVPSQTLGIGTMLVLESNQSGLLVFRGAIPPFSMWEIDWAPDGPAIVDAEWIRSDGTFVSINTHAPTARLDVQFPLWTLQNCPENGLISFRPIELTFVALGSSDPDGLPLARCEWAWSDGAHAEGYAVQRQFDQPGFYLVTLNVWDAEGLSDSVSTSFVVPAHLCGH